VRKGKNITEGGLGANRTGDGIKGCGGSPALDYSKGRITGYGSGLGKGGGCCWALDKKTLRYGKVKVLIDCWR